MSQSDPIAPAIDPRRPVVVFDAECVMCSANAAFILKADRQGRFLLTSIQSETGRRLCAEHGIDPADPTSMLVVEDGVAKRDSDGVLAIWEGLGWPWRAVSIVRVLPRSFRDRVYLAIARNRYRLFGRRDECWVPPPHLRDRIV